MADTSDSSRARGKPLDGWEERFVAALALRGVVTHAVEDAGVARSTVYQRREDDEAFAKDWDDALEEFADALEVEAYRRGVQGVEKPVFYKGEQVSTVLEYSDRMLELMLKARRPEKFRDNLKVEHGGKVGLSLDQLVRRAREE